MESYLVLIRRTSTLSSPMHQHSPSKAALNAVTPKALRRLDSWRARPTKQRHAKTANARRQSKTITFR
ncbi:unnamed protein product [Blumeria hordei]|uniref:Uncharacterized protein n=1 Tax=Blumeria hordei TaxID=2867405 RepID=A0A383UNV6_BLUHO|nr:unnamed protein product [Blumeria hordei]